MKYNEIKIGDKATVVHKITEADIDKFVNLTGDDNKLHINKEFASRTEFKQPVVHGMLGASFISTLIGTKLPGDGALWFSQTLEFLRPVRIDDTITVIAEVIQKNDKANTIELKTDILNQNKQIVTTGFSKVKVVEFEELVVDSLEVKEIQKSVLIIGASGGIGRAAAMKLAQCGYDLILHYNSNFGIVDQLKTEIEKLGRKAICCKANLLDLSDIQNLISLVKREFPMLTGYVNCSTVKLPNIRFQNLEWNNILDHIEINIKSNFLILKEILPIFETKKYGKIVFLTTQAIEYPASEMLHYITSKGALNGFAKALAFEYARQGIRVNMISPSMIDTDLVADVPQKIKMLTEARTPLKKMCSVEDVANAISYLISSDSDFMTGETLRLNGGQIML
jgi:3-oxoacyl-[acyl-carrier protein] reductase